MEDNIKLDVVEKQSETNSYYPKHNLEDVVATQRDDLLLIFEILQKHIREEKAKDHILNIEKLALDIKYAIKDFRSEWKSFQRSVNSRLASIEARQIETVNK